MSHKKKGQLTSHSEWAKHLRKFGKRFFWKAERYEEKRMVDKEISDADDSLESNKKES